MQRLSQLLQRVQQIEGMLRQAQQSAAALCARSRGENGVSAGV